MTTQRKLFVGLAMLAVGISVAVLQARDRGQQQPGMSSQMSMSDMMKGCREHCDRTSKAMNEMQSAMKAAGESNDPAAMRGAMDRMGKSMADMKEHMGMCMRMMETHGKGGMDITFTSQPNPPRTGQNTFEVVVKDAQGKAVADAAVAVSFYMAAMPSMNMPEMRSSAALEHVADGRYRGTGEVVMAGRWDVTVSVSKGGKEIGSRKLTVTAR